MGLLVSTLRFTWHSALMRSLLGVFGGFMLALCFMAGTAAALTAAGWMARADATVAAGMAAFLVWVAAQEHAFAAASAWRAALWELGRAAGFAMLAWVCLHG